MFKRRPTVRKALLFLAVAAIPVLLIVVNQLLAREFEQAGRLAQEVERSYQTRAQLKTILVIHQDVETGQRGYVLTADPAFLEPYSTGRARVRPALERLSSLARDSEVTREGIARLGTLSARKLALSEQVIDLTRNGQRDVAIGLIRSGVGKERMDAIRTLIARLDSAERRALASRIGEAEEARRRAQRLAFRLQALLVLLLVAAAALVMRSLAQRRRALERYRDLSARQEAIFFSAKDGMLILDRHGIIESLNPAAANMYGYAPQDMIGSHVAMLFANPPEEESVAASLERIRSRRGAFSYQTEQFDGRRSDGSTFPTEVATSPVQMESGVCFLSTIRDVSERRQVEQMKSEFVSTVSHELRTPLTSIAGSLGLLAGGAAGALPERVVRLIRIAHSNSQRLVRLINDILDIEKIESGKTKFELKWLKLGPILEQSVQANRAYADEHRITFRLDPVPEDATIVADEDRLLQVMDNLLSNAAKFSPQGESVIISAVPAGERWRISVSDRGAGIPESFRDRIFEKFAQADSSDTRQKGGTGLGLSIVREIVSRLDGSVRFDSRPGEGTTFHVELPALRHAEPETVPALPSGRESGRPRILHVDDDADMLRLVASAFEDKADIVSTPSVREAHAALLRQHFDGAILDVEMADGSGLDLLPMLRSPPRATPTLLFTVHDPSPELTAAADAILTKSRSSLQQLVEHTMRLTSGDDAHKEARE